MSEEQNENKDPETDAADESSDPESYEAEADESYEAEAEAEPAALEPDGREFTHGGVTTQFSDRR